MDGSFTAQSRRFPSTVFTTPVVLLQVARFAHQWQYSHSVGSRFGLAPLVEQRVGNEFGGLARDRVTDNLLPAAVVDLEINAVQPVAIHLCEGVAALLSEVIARVTELRVTHEWPVLQIACTEVENVQPVAFIHGEALLYVDL
jgi:hypothetical protein